MSMVHCGWWWGGAHILGGTLWAWFIVGGGGVGGLWISRSSIVFLDKVSGAGRDACVTQGSNTPIYWFYLLGSRGRLCIMHVASTDSATHKIIPKSCALTCVCESTF